MGSGAGRWTDEAWAVGRSNGETMSAEAWAEGEERKGWTLGGAEVGGGSSGRLVA